MRDELVELESPRNPAADRAAIDKQRVEVNASYDVVKNTNFSKRLSTEEHEPLVYRSNRSRMLTKSIYGTMP